MQPPIHTSRVRVGRLVSIETRTGQANVRVALQKILLYSAYQDMGAWLENKITTVFFFLYTFQRGILPSGKCFHEPKAGFAGRLTHYFYGS